MSVRIAICGIHIEASTFSPHRSSLADFRVLEGDDLVARYPFLRPGSCLRGEAEWVGVLHAAALPGGPVTAAAYHDLRGRIVTGLAAQGPFDGVLFDIHGAMSVEGMMDAEADLLDAVRSVVGDVPVSAAMDLHGNVSERLFDGCDLLTCYRTAPHVDVWETRERAAVNLLDVLARGARPHKALVHVPVLLPGEMTSTRMEPARSLYERAAQLAAAPDMLDASVWIGFAWADEERCCGAVVATGWDAEAVTAAAEELGRLFWQGRHAFGFVAPTGTFEDCLAAAVASEQRPFFVSDSGDNPGAGGADDCTVTLAALLAEPQILSGTVTAVLASICDPEAVARAISLGEGAEGVFEVGGRVDDRPPGRQHLVARVASIAHGTRGGVAARLVVGGLSVVVTERRDQYCELSQFAAVGVDVGATDMVVVKMGYLEPELFAAQRGWLLALTPGGVDQDLRRLGHRRIHRPMFPFDDEQGR